MLKALLRGGAILILTLAVAPVANAATTYTVTDLGTLGGAGSHAWAVNNLGQVVGEAQTADGSWHAFLWSAQDGMRDLGTMGLGGSRASDINDDGVVVGKAGTTPQAFVWTEANGMQPLRPQQYSSDAWGINASGHVVGFGKQTSSAGSRAFLYRTPSDVTDLGQYGALGVNDSDWAVGEIPDPTGTQAGRAVLWAGATATQLPANTYQARRINADGWVVGRTLDYPGAAPAHGFVWDANGGLRTIGTDPSLSSVAYSINDLGEVVGGEQDGSGSWPWYALVWDANSGTRRLDDLINGAYAEEGTWRICDALDVNESGVIVGDGYLAGMSGTYDTLHALLLEPVPVVAAPEPCSLALLTAGLAALAGRRGRRARGAGAR